MAPEEAKNIKETVAKFLNTVQGCEVGKIDFDEMKKEQDKIAVHESFKVRSRLARSRYVTFRMELDGEHHLLSYVREKMT